MIMLETISSLLILSGLVGLGFLMGWRCGWSAAQEAQAQQDKPRQP